MQVQLIKKKANPGLAYIGWLASTKLDGMRCWWDGGCTRGTLKSLVPWANCAKDSRYKSPQVATGLWTRYNCVLHAPDWFLDKLPIGVPLDGELFHTDRQFLFSTVKQLVPDDRWRLIQYHVFEVPPFHAENDRGPATHGMNCSFYDQYPRLLEYTNDTVVRVEQTLVSKPGQAAELVQRVVEQGGEGIVLRNPSGYYYQGRTDNLIRWKGIFDGEGIIKGYTAGRSGITGRNAGRLGALIVLVSSADDAKAVGKTFELSGMNYDDRLLDTDISSVPEGKEVPSNVNGITLKRDTLVKFRYRCLSNDGKPQEARIVNED